VKGTFYRTYWQKAPFTRINPVSVGSRLVIDLAALAVTVPLLVLALVAGLRRPGSSAEAGVSLLGAAFAVLIGAIGGGPAADEVYDVGPTLIFFCILLVLGHLAAADGVFDWAVTLLVRSPGRSPKTVFGRTFLLAAVTTAVLSANATVLLLAPLVVTTAIRISQSPRPHGYASAHMANSASLLMPVSNLTNLLAFTATGLSFLHFTALMALPWLVAVLVEYVLLRRILAGGLTERQTEPAPEPAPIPRMALVVLALTVVGFAVSSVIGVAPVWAAAAGALVLAVRGLIARTSTVASIMDAANVSFALFVLGLAVLVRGIRQNGVDDLVSSILPDNASLAALFVVVAIAALTASLVSNVTATLILVPVAAATLGAPAVLAVLIGANVGANLNYLGSPANQMWRRVLVSYDAAPSPWRFTAVGFRTVPVTLLATTVALWISLRLFG